MLHVKGTYGERARAFTAWTERRGGWISPSVLALALDAAMVGFPPARSLELAQAFVYDRPVRRLRNAS